MRVEWYNDKYGPEKFEENFKELSRRLDNEGISGSSEYLPREVWLIDKGAGKAGQRAFTYVGISDLVRSLAPGITAEIDRRIADNPYSPTIPEEYKRRHGVKYRVVFCYYSWYYGELFLWGHGNIPQHACVGIHRGGYKIPVQLKNPNGMFITRGGNNGGSTWAHRIIVILSVVPQIIMALVTSLLR